MKVGASVVSSRGKFIAPIALIALVIATARTTPTFAAERHVVVNSALNMSTVTLGVAKEKSYIHKYGLDVYKISIPARTIRIWAMLAGEN